MKSARIVIAVSRKERPDIVCCCLGAEDGEPLCICRMRDIDEDLAALEAAGYVVVSKSEPS